MSRAKAMAVVTIGAALLATSAPSAAVAAAAPPGFTVEVLSANGSGCPLDPSSSVTVQVLAGGETTVQYRDFTVAGGDYRTCVVVVNVAASEGWTYAVPTVGNIAWVDLSAGASAKLQTYAWFTGIDWTVTDSTKVDGPLNDFWETTTASEITYWAPCGGSLNLSIAETVRVTGPATDTATLMTTTMFRPAWRRC